MPTISLKDYTRLQSLTQPSLAALAARPKEYDGLLTRSMRGCNPKLRAERAESGNYRLMEDDLWAEQEYRGVSCPLNRREIV